MSSKAEYLKRYLSAGPDAAKPASGKAKKRRKGAIKIVESNEDIQADLDRLQKIRREEQIAEQLAVKQADDNRRKAADEKRVQMRKLDGSGWTQIAVPLKAPPLLVYGLNKRADLDAPRQPAATADLSPQRSGPASDTDPPARRSRSRDSDASSPGRIRHDSPDLSPDRKPRPESPPRRMRHDSPSPRRHDSPDLRRSASPDLSPPRRQRHDSPPAQRHDSPDLSPSRRAPSPDLSPPRRRTAPGRDPSPPRRPMDDDLSPPRPRADADLSPPRKANVSQSTVVRDVHGRVVDVEKAVAEQRRLEQEREAKKAMFWSSGIVQEQEKAARQQKLEQVAATAFARTANDTMMNAELKQQLRFGDPMQFLLDQQNREEEAKERDERGRKQEKKLEKKKKKLQKKLKKLGMDIDDELIEETLKQEAELTSWTHRPVYDGPLWPNRYGTRPGYRWDGVDRTNKWEAERFKIEARREATKVAAYHYSVEDM